MKLIAGKTKGKFVNINALSSEELKNELLNETLQFLGTEHGNAVREVYPSIATPVRGNFSLAGISDINDVELTLLFGFGSKVEKQIKVKLDAKNAGSDGNVYKIWAQKKIAELDLDYEKNRAELTELGQQFGIVTRNTSLIVLETISDYIRYNIEPPSTEPELLAEYQRRQKGREEQSYNTERNILDEALAVAEKLKKWWDTDFAPKKPKYPTPDGKTEPVTSTPSGSAQGGPTPTWKVKSKRGDLNLLSSTGGAGVVCTARFNEEMTILKKQETHALVKASCGQGWVNNSDVERVLQTIEAVDVVGWMDNPSAVFVLDGDGYGGSGSLKAPSSANNNDIGSISQPVIKIKPIKKDNDYLNKLTGKTVDDYQIYLKLRDDYANSPTFYFDMADWFYTHNDKETALRILTSIADLELENASLYRLLGYRFKEYGEYVLEKFVCQKVVEWRPMEPQSYRDYALALADNGEEQSALDSLYSLLTKSYSENIRRRSRGIEEVVVMEINHLIAKDAKLNTSKIDKRLLINTPVDIRVVINWNMDNTDIDLHVKDPNSEECFFRNRETNMGGRISVDVQNGYGPEQFLLKKAVKGKYRVYVNYYGDRQFTYAGPSTIMAEIFIKYADKTEQRKVISLQMSNAKKRDDGKVEVAEFEF
jgi:tetratricopeptide (TPR) repeat protein